MTGTSILTVVALLAIAFDKWTAAAACLFLAYLAYNW